MNRRQSNNTILSISAVATLPILSLTIHATDQERLIRIGLIGVGSAGSSVVASIAQGLPYLAQAIAINANSRALSEINASQAKEMALAQIPEIRAAVSGFDLVFIVVEMAGAIEIGVAPLIAEIARQQHITSFGIAIAPFDGQDLHEWHDLHELQRAGSTVFPISTYSTTHSLGEEINSIRQTVSNLFTCVSHALNQSQLVGIDLESIPAVLVPGDIAAMGFGSAEGVARTENAVKQAIAHPLLGTERLGMATGILINVRGSAASLQYPEVNTVWRSIRPCLMPGTAFLYSGSADESVGDKLIVSILASLPDMANHRTE